VARKRYNDYELLYMVKENHCSIALDILLKKYQNFIYKKIHSFFFYEKYYDDYFQEGVICLLKAINSFEEKYNKTFMRYFEVILIRHYSCLHQKNKREWHGLQALKDDFVIGEETSNSYHYEKIKFKSKLEQDVYELYYLKNKTITKIAEILTLNSKQVYNAIYRIKRKLKKIEL